MINHLNITIYGDVQGVFFRRTVKHAARRLGISGFVRNESDGSVYLEAEADGKVLEKFTDWLKAGASAGPHKVSRVEVKEGKFKAWDEEFRIEE